MAILFYVSNLLFVCVLSCLLITQVATYKPAIEIAAREPAADCPPARTEVLEAVSAQADTWRNAPQPATSVAGHI
jgi:hypothetical protein